jgi:hypothetical protein
LSTLKSYQTTPIGDPVLVPASDKRDEYTPINPIDELPINVEDLL